MKKYFLIDFFLILLTTIGLYYLFTTKTIGINLAILILVIYVLSKVVGYLILPYEKFDIFINHLSKESKLSFLSGFEIFKTILVILLYLGFVFLNPTIWIIESILVVTMRIWGLAYIKNLGRK